MRQIKLIWDFRGPASAKTAEHHAIHLREFIGAEALPISICDSEVLSDMHAVAFMVCTDEHLLKLRDALKPHRAELWTT